MNFSSVHSVKLDFPQFHDQLAAGGDITIVTPNRRLAIYLKRRYDEAQIAAGRRAWHAADILPLPTFLERSWRALILRHADAGLPQLLSAMQCQFAWEEVIRQSDERAGLLNVAQAAKQALSAWQLANAWRLLPPLRNFQAHEDVRVFISWMRQYQTLFNERNWIDGATLADSLTAAVATQGDSKSVLPVGLWVAGFDLVTPQHRDFFSACGDMGVDVRRVESEVARAPHALQRFAFPNEVAEWRACVAWARRHIEASPQSRVAIVVPDLESARNALSRLLTDTLAPQERSGSAGVSPGTSSPAARHFNISLGQPLADYALVHDALSLIEFGMNRPVPFLHASALLRSPYIGEADSEMNARAALDAVLREISSPEISLFSLQKKLKLAQQGRIASAAAAGEKFLARLDRVADLPPPVVQSRDTRNPVQQDWGRYFGGVLSAWGFPGEASLGSIEFQVLAKFRDALASLATLQAVQPRMKADQALAQLRRIVADTVFQPETNDDDDAPIQVLGILESAGQQFDALWVTGLSNDAWPLAARPNPFIPAVLQRNAGVTEASASASLALDRRITAGWANSADEVIFSHAWLQSGVGAGEQPREASALIAGIPLSDLGAISNPIFNDFASALQALGAVEPIPDVANTPLPTPAVVRGGATVMRDQAACPFRAFARHRLSARTLEVPGPGLDAAERGTLLHRALSLLWGDLRTHAGLMALDDAQIMQTIQQAVARAMSDARSKGVENLTGRFATIEEARLCRLLKEWLDYERERSPFDVIEREQQHDVTIGGLSLKLQLDRMDRLADGTHALIDYKTGAAKLSSWLGERPDEPQLPLYFVTADQAVSIVAFARVKRGERGKVFGFEGVSAVEGLLPDVKPIEQKRGMEQKGYSSWDVLVQEWETSMHALATDFAEGVATVDPKHGGQTCAQCDLQGLCRIAESSGYAALEVGAGDRDGQANEGDDD